MIFEAKIASNDSLGPQGRKVTYSKTSQKNAKEGLLLLWVDSLSLEHETSTGALANF